MVSKDPLYEEKKERILQLYNNPPDDGTVVSFDEKGSITLKEYVEAPPGLSTPKRGGFQTGRRQGGGSSSQRHTSLTLAGYSQDSRRGRGRESSWSS
jgi:hypothetical protein